MKNYICLFCLILIVGCSSDDDSQTNEIPENQLKLIEEKTFSINNGFEELESTFKYEYGANNKISRFISINANGTFVTNYQYNGDNNVVKTDAVGSGYFEYIYSNNLLTTTSLYTSDDDEFPDVFTFYYNQNGAVTKEERSFEGTLICVKLYNDDNAGNYTTLDDQCGQTVYQITHGVGKDPNYLLGANPIYIANGISFNVVNQYDVTITHQNGDTTELIYSYEYTYNEKNYPLTRLDFYDGVLRGRKEYTYN